MKKSFAPDITDSINKIQQQLVALERKIDTLVSASSPGQRPFQQPGRANNYGDRRPENNYRERTLYKAICADCRHECEVPFKPSGERPVYCKECFSKRKGGGSFRERSDRERPDRERPDNRPREREAAPVETARPDKPWDFKKKKSFKRKKPSAKRRK